MVAFLVRDVGELNHSRFKRNAKYWVPVPWFCCVGFASKKKTKSGFFIWPYLTWSLVKVSFFLATWIHADGALYTLQHQVVDEFFQLMDLGTSFFRASHSPSMIWVLASVVGPIWFRGFFVLMCKCCCLVIHPHFAYQDKFCMRSPGGISHLRKWWFFKNDFPWPYLWWRLATCSITCTFVDSSEMIQRHWANNSSGIWHYCATLSPNLVSCWKD